MVTVFTEIVKNFKVISKNLRALVLISVLGLTVGFAGYPLWLLYRNEQQVLTYFTNRNVIEEPYSRNQLNNLRNKLNDVYRLPGVNRVIFGTVTQDNRTIHLEVFSPVGNPLPTGYRSVYLKTPHYSEIYESLLNGHCILIKPNLDSYLGTELTLSNSVSMLSCPSSKSNWFLAAYLSDYDPLTLEYLKKVVRDLESDFS